MANTVVEISERSFNTEVLRSDEPAVVMFFSHSCPHCKMFSPVYTQLCEAFGGEVRFFKVDVLRSDRNRRLAFSRAVRSVPTLEVFYQGRVIGSVVGCHELGKVTGAVEGFLARKGEHVGPSTPLAHIIAHEKPSKERTKRTG